ncbi:MAG: magnesium transporter MgtE N-terminal domain-containing protein [Halobacteriota archaeon]
MTRKEDNVPLLSNFIKNQVKDARGNGLGKLGDLVISALETPYPTVKSLLVNTSEGEILVPWNQVGELAGEIRLNVDSDDVTPYNKLEHDIMLVADVLDMQLMDVEGKKIRRVNDVQLALANGSYQVMGLEIGARSFLRRLGAQPVANGIGMKPHGFIPWDAIDIIQSDAFGIRLTVSKDVIARLHAPDSSELATQLKGMNNANAAELIDEMELDDAADVLRELPQERIGAILEQLKVQQSKDIVELLEYSKKGRNDDDGSL